MNTNTYNYTVINKDKAIEVLAKDKQKVVMSFTLDDLSIRLNLDYVLDLLEVLKVSNLDLYGCHSHAKVVSKTKEALEKTEQEYKRVYNKLNETISYFLVE